MSNQEFQQTVQLLSLASYGIGGTTIFILGILWGQHGRISGMKEQVAAIIKANDDHRATVSAALTTITTKLDTIGQDVAVLKDRDSRPTVPKA